MGYLTGVLWRIEVMCEVDIAVVLQQQILANLALERRLIEKDKLIHSLANELIDASEMVAWWGNEASTYAQDKHGLDVDVMIIKDVAQSALDSITDKGEKDAEITIKKRIEAENRNKAFMADLADSEGSF